jgi:hypothetical protein
MPSDILEKPATVEDVAREVSKIRSIVTDAVEDGVLLNDDGIQSRPESPLPRLRQRKLCPLPVMASA